MATKNKNKKRATKKLAVMAYCWRRYHVIQHEDLRHLKLEVLVKSMGSKREFRWRFLTTEGQRLHHRYKVSHIYACIDSFDIRDLWTIRHLIDRLEVWLRESLPRQTAEERRELISHLRRRQERRVVRPVEIINPDLI